MITKFFHETLQYAFTSKVYAQSLIDQHYLQIQALSPAQDHQDPISATSTESFWILSSSNMSLLIIGIIGIFLLGFTWLLYSQIKDYHKLFTVMTVGVLIGGMALVVNSVSQTTQTVTRAKFDSTPQNLIVSEVTHDSFSISWQTPSPTLGGIIIGTLADGSDRRFLFQSRQANRNHRINVTELVPGTRYYVKIFSDGVIFDDSGQHIKVTTLDK